MFGPGCKEGVVSFALAPFRMIFQENKAIITSKIIYPQRCGPLPIQRAMNQSSKLQAQTLSDMKASLLVVIVQHCNRIQEVHSLVCRTVFG